MRDSIVMTLLAPRRKLKHPQYPLAVQMAVPKSLTPWKTAALISVRLITADGTRATALETMDHYDPKKWRAASRSEQSLFTLEYRRNPQPWYSIIYCLSENVYNYRGSGDRDTNNGQHWPEIVNLDREFEAEQVRRALCEEVLMTEWNRRIATWGESD